MQSLLLTLALMRGADIASTTVVLHRGGFEQNPVMGSTISQVVTRGTFISVGELVGLHMLSTHHPKLAKTLASVSIGISGAAAGHNVAIAVRLQ